MLDGGIKSSRCYFGLLLSDWTVDICLALVPPAVARDDSGCHGGNAFLFFNADGYAAGCAGGRGRGPASGLRRSTVLRSGLKARHCHDVVRLHGRDFNDQV